MNATIFDRKHSGGKDCYLVQMNQAVAFIDYLEWASRQAEKTVKITVSRYRGKKYCADAFIWVCIQ